MNAPMRALKRGQTLRREPQRGIVEIESCGDCGLQVGACGCNGSAPTMYASSGVPNGAPLGGTVVANPGGGDIYIPPPGAGCFPQRMCDRDGRFAYQTYREIMRRESRMKRAPYADPWLDLVEMDTLYSAPTTIAAGATTNVEVQPTAGTFAVYYWDIVVVDPTTQVQQVDWRAGQPRIEGCPIPCVGTDQPALAQFVMKVPENCCGQPLVAWIDRASEDLPLQIPVTNNQASGDILAQVRVRGYCCSTRIC
jgi:hypothetical protein